MANHNPQPIDINTLDQAKNEIRDIGSDPKSINIMASKAVFRMVKLENVCSQDAIIVKQDMLSIGGEVAIPKNVFELKDEMNAILIMGTLHQFKGLITKLLRHYSRIQKIAQEIKFLLQEEL